MEDKRKAATKINEIQGKVQDVYFDLEEFSDKDTGGSAQKKVIELIDAITSIRRRILQNTPDINITTKDTEQ